MKGALITILVLFGLLAAAAMVAWWAWTELADVQISQQGYIALGIGVAVTMILGVGLMWLVFYSSRSGHDERVGRD